MDDFITMRSDVLCSKANTHSFDSNSDLGGLPSPLSPLSSEIKNDSDAKSLPSSEHKCQSYGKFKTLISVSNRALFKTLCDFEMDVKKYDLAERNKDTAMAIECSFNITNQVNVIMPYWDSFCKEHSLTETLLNAVRVYIKNETNVEPTVASGTVMIQERQNEGQTNVPASLVCFHCGASIRIDQFDKHIRDVHAHLAVGLNPYFSGNNDKTLRCDKKRDNSVYNRSGIDLENVQREKYGDCD